MQIQAANKPMFPNANRRAFKPKPACGIRGLLLPLALPLLVFSAAGQPAAGKPPPAPPNIIVILTDDQGYHDVGFNGCRDIPTPNLDSIAANGVRFPNGYVSYSVCSPSRAGLLTGRYEQRFGHERNPRFEPENPRSGLPLSESTLADVLGRVGYQSGIIGKWHLGAHPDLHPLNRGFNGFFGMLGGGHRYFPEELTLKTTGDAGDEAASYRLQILRDHTPVRTTQYLTDEFSDEAVRFVERHKDRPFFLYLAYNAPHTPLQATEKYLGRFPNIKNPKRRTYAAMVSAVDDGVGRLLAKLREQGIEENTLVFYLSDNGGPTDANASNNDPLRGSKGTPWEGGWRVPFAAQWPGHLPQGRVYEPPVTSLDIFATAAALAAAPVDPSRPLDGVNLVPFLTGEQTGVPHETIYLRMYDRGAFAVRSGAFKLVIPQSGSAPQLFNLAADAGESSDLAGAHPEQLARLEERRAAWNTQLVAPVFDGLLSPKQRSKTATPAEEVDP
ncbi:MAG: sulfatase-like hydrolase/transferase [Verrucomicrobia bacterium]|nr:sulfatase-like hydrolase/transferase [Verrucomicrobiota bacterium]